MWLSTSRLEKRVQPHGIRPVIVQVEPACQRVCVSRGNFSSRKARRGFMPQRDFNPYPGFYRRRYLNGEWWTDARTSLRGWPRSLTKALRNHKRHVCRYCLRESRGFHNDSDCCLRFHRDGNVRLQRVRAVSLRDIYTDFSPRSLKSRNVSGGCNIFLKAFCNFLYTALAKI